MKFLSDHLFFGAQLVELFTGKYFLHCDTLGEVKAALKQEKIKGIRFAPLTKMKLSGNYLLCQISREEDYTEHDLYAVLIPDDLLKKVKQGIKDF
jgi:hypothetical protein